jgi:hypothetical protein
MGLASHIHRPPPLLQACLSGFPGFGRLTLQMTASFERQRLRSPLRLASLMPQAFSADHFGTRSQQRVGCLE